MALLNDNPSRLGVKFARWFFTLAALYGIPVMLGFFLHTPEMLGKAPWRQPEMYYGFASVTLAWQIRVSSGRV